MPAPHRTGYDLECDCDRCQAAHDPRHLVLREQYIAAWMEAYDSNNQHAMQVVERKIQKVARQAKFRVTTPRKSLAQARAAQNCTRTMTPILRSKTPYKIGEDPPWSRPDKIQIHS